MSQEHPPVTDLPPKHPKSARRIRRRPEGLAKSAKYSIIEASEACGFTPSLLRIWELRYHWPMPIRANNGYRYYTHKQVDDLKYVKDLVDGGASISELMGDQKLDLQQGNLRARLEVRPVPKPVLDFSDIPMPKTAQGKRIRVLCEEAIRRQNHGALEQLKAEVLLVHPTDRENALYAPLLLYKDQV